MEQKAAALRGFGGEPEARSLVGPGCGGGARGPSGWAGARAGRSEILGRAITVRASAKLQFLLNNHHELTYHHPSPVNLPTMRASTSRLSKVVASAALQSRVKRASYFDKLATAESLVPLCRSSPRPGSVPGGAQG